LRNETQEIDLKKLLTDCLAHATFSAVSFQIPRALHY